MATTNKKINFSYFERKQDFTASLQAELTNNIVFVEDTKEVFTHGEFFGIRNVTLNYDSSTTRLQLKDGDVVVSEMDATAFVKDGMLDSVELVKTQESGVSETVPYLKFVFNSHVIIRAFTFTFFRASSLKAIPTTLRLCLKNRRQSQARPRL